MYIYIYRRFEMLEMTFFNSQACLISKELKYLETEFHYFGLCFFPDVYHRRQNEILCPCNH
jgi:hypothetical protein